MNHVGAERHCDLLTDLVNSPMSDFHTPDSNTQLFIHDAHTGLALRMLKRANNIENTAFACFCSMTTTSYDSQRKKRKFGKRNGGASTKLYRPAYEHL